ncbi:MAG: peptidylprolyl isomerase [Proteobacteria bacterium]|nr:peptidylprolyl isomerase [Pseudomonadota bacterium]
MKVQITTTLGPITLQLNPDKAPKTVENFLSYVQNGFYEGTIFHRVIEDFMIQGGGLDKDMNTKPTNAPVKNEANNGLKNAYGTIAMARTADPHSASAQFFINTNDNPFLDFQAESEEGWGYCVFGEVIEGIEVVNNIEEKPTTTRDGHQDVPEEIIGIEKVDVFEED